MKVTQKRTGVFPDFFFVVETRKERMHPIKKKRSEPYFLCRRRQVFDAFDAQCFYCAAPLKFISFTIDHIIPKFRGGNEKRPNLAAACLKCNQQKGNREPTQQEIRD